MAGTVEPLQACSATVCDGTEQQPASPHEDRQPRDGDDVDPPLYCTDEFRIYYMKVLPCSKRYCHDWTTCPFAHPGEKARRRDPRTSSYTGIACPDMKKDGVCVRGELCPYAHNVFEYWLHPTRYRTQLCNDGTNCKRRVCFFAHTLPELRVPSSKPFVNPQALAAAAAAANAKRAGMAGDQAANDLTRLRGGQSVGHSAGAADLAQRLTSLQLGQQLAMAQQAQHAAVQQKAQAASDQNALLLQLLSSMLAQKQEQAGQQQHQQQLPPELQEQLPSSNALAALYQELGGSTGGPSAGNLPMPQQQQQLWHDSAFTQQRQDQAALLAALDPPGQHAQLLGGKEGGSVQHATPRSSLEVAGAAGLFGMSEYSTPRSSFELPQTRTPRSSFDVFSYTARSSLESQRTSAPRSSLDSGSGASTTTGRPPSNGYLQDVLEGEPAAHGAAPSGLSADASPFLSPGGPMAFGPGGAYFLTGASATAAAASRAFGSAAGGVHSFGNGVNQRSASLPAYLPKPGFGAAGVASALPLRFAAASPSAHSGASAYFAGDAPRQISCDYPNAAAACSDALPPRAPGSRYSLDSRLQQGGNEFQHHLLGALPGSFNYFASVSDSEVHPRTSLDFGPAASAFNETRHSSLPHYAQGTDGADDNAGGSVGSLFENPPQSAAPAGDTSAAAGSRAGALNLGALYQPSNLAPAGGSKSRSGSAAGSGSASPHRSIWSPQP